MIRITSKKAGFRRCGMPHPKEPVDYPDDRFSEEELDILKAEPMLIVEIIAEGPESMTVAQLKKDLDVLGIGYPDKIRKAELIEVYKRAHE